MRANAAICRSSRANDVGEFLAERRRRRRLAVGAREHRQIGMRVRKRAEVRGDRFEQRQQRARARASASAMPYDEIVDVLGRAREVDELRDARDPGRRRDALLQPVFDGLDVVVGRALDRLDARCVGDAKRRGDLLERGPVGVRERRHFGDRALGRECQQPRHFDANALANQCELAELVAQRVDLSRVAAVERRQRGQPCVFSGIHGGSSSNRV